MALMMTRIGLLSMALIALLAACVTGVGKQSASQDPVLTRGQYLAEHVVNCVQCHTRDHDKSVWGSPPVAPFYSGKDCPVTDVNPAARDRPEARMSKLCTPNITSDPVTGIGGWSKTDIVNAFRDGMRPDGSPLFPIMWLNLHAISDEDAYAIATWIQSLQPIVHEQPGRGQVMNQKLHDLVMSQLPESPAVTPPKTDPVAYGAYLAQIARCQFCHTPRDAPGRSQPEKAWTGGARYPDSAGGFIYSTNLTPHKEGLGNISREEFIAMFRARGGRVPAGESNTVMPWVAFAGMTDADLGAIWAMLRTLEPKPSSVSPKYDM